MARVLIVDDEKSIRLTLSEFLKGVGHEVSTAATAEEALEATHRQRYDVIVTDIILPRINGMELLQQFKQILPDAEYIIISGEPNVTSVTEALHMGVFDYLPKPVTSSDIINVVGKAYELKTLKDTKKRLEEENRRYQEHLEKLVEERTAELMKTNQALAAEIGLRAIAQQELENSKEELSLVINSLPLLIAYIDAELNYLILNEPFQYLLERQHVHLEEKSFKKILGTKNWAKLEPHIQKVLTGRQVFFTAELDFGDEQISFYRIYLIPHDGGREWVKAFVFLAEDITAISTVEQEYFKVQRLESLTTLAEGIANDVNNSLMVIFGSLSILKSQYEGHQNITELLYSIEQSADKIKDLTRQLLSFSLKRPLNRKETDLNLIIPKILSMFYRQEKRDYRFFPAPNSIKVLLDEGQFSQAFYNLIKNTIASVPRENELTISLDQCALPEQYQINMPPGDYARIIVKLGYELFTQEDNPFIFEPYYRLRKTKVKFDLAIIYAVIYNHGGTIIPSVENGCTQFEILLPVHSELMPLPHIGFGEELLKRHHVLLMDDEESVLEILGKMLNNLNCTYERAFNGEEALQLAQSRLAENNPFDLAILDLFIPGGRGAIDIVTPLKALQPSLKIILSSGFHLDAVMVKYEEYGFDGAIRKPFDIKDLKRLLKTLLD